MDDVKVEEYLKHYGILGMKWGKRKGSSQPVQTSNRRMSKKELQAKVNRLKLEQEYAKLTATPKQKSRVESLVKTAGTVAALSTSALTIYNNMDKITKLAKAARAAT